MAGEDARLSFRRVDDDGERRHGTALPLGGRLAILAGRRTEQDPVPDDRDVPVVADAIHERERGHDAVPAQPDDDLEPVHAAGPRPNREAVERREDRGVRRVPPLVLDGVAPRGTTAAPTTSTPSAPIGATSSSSAVWPPAFHGIGRPNVTGLSFTLRTTVRGALASTRSPWCGPPNGRPPGTNVAARSVNSTTARMTSAPWPIGRRFISAFADAAEHRAASRSR